jgi:TRAP-type C4-dicarboxylate transport system permease small subunit
VAIWSNIMSVRERLVMLAGWVQRGQLWVAASALVILMSVTVLDVFMRYVFTRPIRASLDTVEVMLLVFVFNGMAAAFFGRRHIVIDLLDGVFGARGTAVLIRIADVLSVLCLLLLAWAMLLPATQAYQYGDAKMELPIPIYVLWIVALVSLAGTIFCALVTLAAMPAVTERGPAA